MQASYIDVQVHNRVGHLTLNRPAELNALSLTMVRDLHRQLRLWADDPKVVAIVLRSASAKAFCAGGDVRALYESFVCGDDLHLHFFAEEYALDQYIHAYSKPIIALIDGFCLGGGMGLVQGARFRVVTEVARLGMPETAIGYFPDVGASYFLSRLEGFVGVYLGITGQQVNALDARDIGLADYAIERSQIHALDQALACMVWVGDASEQLRALLLTLASDGGLESELKPVAGLIERCFSQSELGLIYKALEHERRGSLGDFATRTLDLLNARSPLAMSVTLELLARGRQLSLAECFALEMHLDRQWFAHGNIVEGVRALLVDKDKKPRWQPASIAQVTKAQVQRFFQGFMPGTSIS